MKLNIGAGNKRPDGYFHIDAVQHPSASRLDLQCEADSIYLRDGCADEVMAIHLVEHIYPHHLHATLVEWHRLLRSGGLLVLEMPDIGKCIKNWLAGKDESLSLRGIYGENPGGSHFDCHKWGWDFRSLAPKVANAGFVSIVEKQTEHHKKGRGVRDFRLEAVKP